MYLHFHLKIMRIVTELAWSHDEGKMQTPPARPKSLPHCEHTNSQPSTACLFALQRRSLQKLNMKIH
jgi:hypothetical protein